MSASEPSAIWRPPESSPLYPPALARQIPGWRGDGLSLDAAPPLAPPSKFMLWLAGPGGSVTSAAVAAICAVSWAGAAGLLIVIAVTGHPVAALRPGLEFAVRWLVPSLDVLTTGFLAASQRRVSQSRIARVARAWRRPRPASAARLVSRPGRLVVGAAAALTIPLAAFLLIWALTHGGTDPSGRSATEPAQLFGIAFCMLHLLGWGGLAYRVLARNRARAFVGRAFVGTPA